LRLSLLHLLARLSLARSFLLATGQWARLRTGTSGPASHFTHAHLLIHAVETVDSQ
jgi:hypothetical protein